MKHRFFAYALATVSTLASFCLPATALEGSSNVQQAIDSNIPTFKPPPGRPTNPDRRRDDNGRTRISDVIPVQIAQAIQNREVQVGESSTLNVSHSLQNTQQK